MPLETIKTARSLVSLSIFAAGGITVENVHLLLDLKINGVAVTSTVLWSKSPEQTARKFKEILAKYSDTIN